MNYLLPKPLGQIIRRLYDWRTLPALGLRKFWLGR